jgi:hypothetical protein
VSLQELEFGFFSKKKMSKPRLPTLCKALVFPSGNPLNFQGIIKMSNVNKTVFAWVYNSFPLLCLYKAYKYLARLICGTSELYRICDTELRQNTSTDFAQVSSLVLSDDGLRVEDWKNVRGERLGLPRVRAYTLFRIDQSLLYSSKLLVISIIFQWKKIIWKKTHIYSFIVIPSIRAEKWSPDTVGSFSPFNPFSTPKASNPSSGTRPPTPQSSLEP